MKFKIVVLQSLHNLSDEQTEYLIRDRLSFMRFLDLDLEDPVPDATTIWLFREALAQAGLIDKLFERFGQHLEAEGYIARGGQIIDATIVSVPKHATPRRRTRRSRPARRPRDGSSRRSRSEKMDGARRSPRIISSGGILMGCSTTGPCSWSGSVTIGSTDRTNGP